MSSHGVPHEAHHTEDDGAKKVGVLAAVLAIGLTIVTIASHRTHTLSIVARSEANDKWSFYQSKRIKFHSLELGLDLIALQGPKGEVSEKMSERYTSEKERQAREGQEIRVQAEEKEKESRHAEEKALRFDIAEGLFEIGLVMSSLFFLAHRKIFPVIGVLGGLAGIVLGILGAVA